MTTTKAYPGLLAKGVTAQDLPPAFELYAGSSDVVTDSGQAGGTDLEQFRVIARDESGKLVPWNRAAGAATGALTFSGVGTAADTITINGTVITLVAGAPAAGQVQIGASATLTAQAVKAYINAHPDDFNVRATGAAAVLTLTALEAGVGGNSIATVESGTNTAFGSATLTGGSAESEKKAIGFTAQPILAGVWGPIFTGGDFNHLALVWPADVTSLADRKAAFDGSNINIKRLL